MYLNYLAFLKYYRLGLIVVRPQSFGTNPSEYDGYGKKRAMGQLQNGTNNNLMRTASHPVLYWTNDRMNDGTSNGMNDGMSDGDD